MSHVPRSTDTHCTPERHATGCGHMYWERKIQMARREVKCSHARESLGCVHTHCDRRLMQSQSHCMHWAVGVRVQASSKKPVQLLRLDFRSSLNNVVIHLNSTCTTFVTVTFNFHSGHFFCKHEVNYNFCCN